MLFKSILFNFLRVDYSFKLERSVCFPLLSLHSKLDDAKHMWRRGCWGSSALRFMYPGTFGICQTQTVQVLTVYQEKEMFRDMGKSPCSSALLFQWLLHVQTSVVLCLAHRPITHILFLAFRFLKCFFTVYLKVMLPLMLFYQKHAYLCYSSWNRILQNLLAVQTCFLFIVMIS